MSKSKYKADNSKSTGLGGFLRSDGGLQDALLKVAEGGKAFAESIAPVGETGEYAASFEVTEESGREDSVGAMLVNTSGHAARVEFDLTHTLAKAADHMRGTP